MRWAWCFLKAGAVRNRPWPAVLLGLWLVLAGPLGAGTGPTNRPVRVGITRDFPPYEYLNAKGEPDGYDVEVLKAAAAVMNLPLEFKAAPWETIYADLVAGRIQVAPGVLYSGARAARVDFCAPHLVVHYSIFHRKEATPLEGLPDLRGRRILVERGSQMAEFLVAQGYGSCLVPVESEPEAVRLLASGAQDAAIVPRLLGLGMIQEFHLRNLRLVGGPVYARDLCFAVAPGQVELKASLETGLAILNRTKHYDAIYGKWFGQLEPAAQVSSRLLRLALGTVAGALVLLLVALLWTAVLNRQVRQRTRQLRQANQAIEENACLLAAIVDTLPLGLFAKDPNNGYRYALWNTKAEEIFGLSRDQVLGKTDADFWPPEQAACFHEVDLQVISQGTLVDVPVEPIDSRSRGTILLHTIKVAVQDSQGHASLLLGLSEDITQRLRLEEERRSLEARLQESQKLDSLGSLAGGVAHDMNNVLGSILGLATAFRNQAEPGSPLARALETITMACVRGGTMVRGLLTFARQQLTEEKELEVNTLIRELMQLLERTTLARVRLQLELAEDLQPILGDASALTHALMNVCVNAVEAMGDNGLLRVATRNRGAWVEIEVADTGCGMLPAVLEQALNPFFTTKSHGTGLGLSIVHSTLKAHRGLLRVESRPGKGTQVVLSLPAGPAAQAGGGTPVACAEQPAHPMAILLVDDDELIRTSLTEVLEMLGHTCTAVANGEAALALLEAGLEPDAVVLDVNMPGLGGAGTLPRLRRLRPRLPVLLSTGRADQAALDLAAAHGGVQILAKPFTARALGQALAALPPR